MHSVFLALSDSDDKFVIFERWLLENGTRMPKLELKVQLPLFLIVPLAYSAHNRIMEMKFEDVMQPTRLTMMK